MSTNQLLRLEVSKADKVERLRELVKEGFDELERGEGLAFNSDGEFEAFLEQLGNGVAPEVAVANHRAAKA